MATDPREHVERIARHLAMLGEDVEGMEVHLPKHAFDHFLWLAMGAAIYTGFQSKPQAEITHFLFRGIRFVRASAQQSDAGGGQDV